jgi:DNA polymerase III subunit epsilon
MNRQIILDTETTGISHKEGHRVIEIGCVEIVNRKFTGKEFQTYLNPGRESEEQALRVHGLTTEFLRDKPLFKDIYEDFINFIQDSELLIHNAEFDVGFINNEINLVSKELAPLKERVSKITDTLHIAREKHPGQRNSLDALVKRYEVRGYDRELHGALLDSKILGDVFLRMTGGQGSLDFNLENSDEVNAESDSLVLDENKRPQLASLTPEDIKNNEVYLTTMENETGVKPLWLSDNNGK